jgi:hypothetical protein
MLLNEALGCYCYIEARRHSAVATVDPKNPQLVADKIHLIYCFHAAAWARMG